MSPNGGGEGGGGDGDGGGGEGEGGGDLATYKKQTTDALLNSRSGRTDASCGGPVACAGSESRPASVALGVGPFKLRGSARCASPFV